MNLSALDAWAPRVLSILRIMAALLFIQHGTQKLLDFPLPGNPLNTMSLIAGVLELFGGALLAIGLFTRPVAFVLSGLMAAAYFIAHAGWSFAAPPVAGVASFYPIANRGELAIMYCFTFLYFVFSGPGPWSVDAMRSRSSRI